jgi:hypothetical protein
LFATGIVQPALLLRAVIVSKEKREFGSASGAGGSCFVKPALRGSGA